VVGGVATDGVLAVVSGNVVGEPVVSVACWGVTPV
jgi:hypothetical protein